MYAWKENTTVTIERTHTFFNYFQDMRKHYGAPICLQRSKLLPSQYRPSSLPHWYLTYDIVCQQRLEKNEWLNKHYTAYSKSHKDAGAHIHIVCIIFLCISLEWKLQIISNSFSFFYLEIYIWLALKISAINVLLQNIRDIT